MRKRFLGLVLAIVCIMGLCTPALATSTSKDLTEEEIQNMISVTYSVDGTKINIRDGIEVEESVTYLRLEDHSDKNIMDKNYRGNIKKVSTTEGSYLAIRDNSTFEVSITGGTQSISSTKLEIYSFLTVYATAYMQNDSGVYEPEYTCRQCLTSRGFVDENRNWGSATGIIDGYPAQFKLPISTASLFGKEKTDVLYGFEVDLFQSDSRSGWKVYRTYFVAKIDDEAVDAYLAGQESSTDDSDDPAVPAQPETATPTSSTVLVNGEQVAFDAYNINGSNYFKLRDLAYVLSGTEKQFEVGWDNAAKAISLTSGEAYTAVGGEMTGKGSGTKTANPSSAKIILDGSEISLTAYEIDGNNYFKLRDIGQTFDFGVGWDNASKTITIDTSTGYTEE